jgi:hypothetical protein
MQFPGIHNSRSEIKEVFGIARGYECMPRKDNSGDLGITLSDIETARLACRR